MPIAVGLGSAGPSSASGAVQRWDDWLMEPADEAALPVLSVARYTDEDEGYDEVFISLRDGQEWSGTHVGHRLVNVASENNHWIDLDVVVDDEGRAVALIFRDASEVHPSLLAVAQLHE